jgi:hypothetical protein
MTVSPFCELPGLAGKFVIVGLQETPYDARSSLKIHTTCDEVCRALAQAEGLDLEHFLYRIPFSVVTKERDNRLVIIVRGPSEREPPSFIDNVVLSGNGFNREEEAGQDGSIVIDAPRANGLACTIHFKCKCLLLEVSNCASWLRGRTNPGAVVQQCIRCSATPRKDSFSQVKVKCHTFTRIQGLLHELGSTPDRVPRGSFHVRA